MRSSAPATFSTRVVCSETGSPHAPSARYASCRVAGRNPSMCPSPWQIIRSLRRAVTAGSFCRSDPAALLRGLANGVLPSSTSAALSASKSATRKNTSPRTSRTAGIGYAWLAVNCPGTSSMVRFQRDVLAGTTVAPRCRPDQPTIAVDQSQSDTVDLELTQIRHVRNITADLSADARCPQVEFFGTEHVVQGQHPFQMVGRREISGEARAADELSGRIRCAQLGMLFLECGEPPQHLVEFRVGDDGRVTHVVAELVFAHLVGQFTPLPPNFGRDGISLWRTHLGRLSEGSDRRRAARQPRLPLRLPWAPRTQPWRQSRCGRVLDGVRVLSECVSGLVSKPDRGAGPLRRCCGQATRWGDAHAVT